MPGITTRGGKIIQNVFGVLYGETAPTQVTDGSPGQLYLDTSSDEVYVCVNVIDTKKELRVTWAPITSAKAAQSLVVQTNANTATAALGTIKLLGLNGLSTDGSGNAVTITKSADSANVSSTDAVDGALSAYVSSQPGLPKIVPIPFTSSVNGDVVVVHGKGISSIPRETFFVPPSDAPAGALYIKENGTQRFIAPLADTVLSVDSSGKWALVTRDTWDYGDMHASSHLTDIGQLVITNDKAGREYAQLDSSPAEDGNVLKVSKLDPKDPASYVYGTCVSAIVIAGIQKVFGDIEIVGAGTVDVKFDDSANKLTFTGSGGGGAGNMVAPASGVTAGAIATYKDSVGHQTEQIPYGPTVSGKILAVNAAGDGYEWVSKPAGTQGVISDTTTTVVGNIPKASNTTGDHISFTKAVITDDGDISAASLLLATALPVSGGGTGLKSLPNNGICVTSAAGSFEFLATKDSSDNGKSPVLTASGIELRSQISDVVIDNTSTSDADGVVTLKTDSTISFDTTTQTLGVADPLDTSTEGTMYYASGGVVAEIPPGRVGYVLEMKSDGAGGIAPEWVPNSGGGSKPTIQHIGSDKTNTLSPNVIYVCDDASTACVIASAAEGDVFQIITPVKNSMSLAFGASVSLAGNGGAVWSSTTTAMENLDANSFLKMLCFADNKLIITEVTGNYTTPL